jgi:membrane associated rhomboid family serine protease
MRQFPRTPPPPTMSFGPGPMTPAVKAILIANAVVFVLGLVGGEAVASLLGLSPVHVLTNGRLWQPFTYLFVHSSSSISHIVFNMLAIWMFGVELERRWGTTFFTKYYFVCGVGAAACTIVASLLPFAGAAAIYDQITIGASGAVYGLLMAWALLFPHRQILFMFVFPLPARVFVLLIGAIAFFSALGAGGGPVAHVAHLGGLVIGWLYLKGPKDLQLAWKYRLTKWRMERMRKRFNVHQGGRGGWNDRVH